MTQLRNAILRLQLIESQNYFFTYTNKKFTLIPHLGFQVFPGAKHLNKCTRPFLPHAWKLFENRSILSELWKKKRKFRVLLFFLFFFLNSHNITIVAETRQRFYQNLLSQAGSYKSPLAAFDRRLTGGSKNLPMFFFSSIPSFFTKPVLTLWSFWNFSEKS